MEINSLPIRRLDETLYSIAARTRWMNVAKDDRDACRSLFGYFRHTRVSDFPVDLVHFCAVTGEQYGNPQDVLNEMTLAEFFNRIGSHPWHSGSLCLPFATAGYGLSTLSNGHTNTWRACSLCLESEMSLAGTAFWHRSHHLPTAFFCPAHRVPLSVCVSPIQVRHNCFLLPQDTLLTDRFHGIVAAENQDLLLRLTKLGMDILFDTERPIDQGTAQAAIFDALNEKCLLTSSKLMCREPFFTEFSRRYSFLHRFPGLSDAVSSRGIEILLRKLQRENINRSAIHNLLLIDWLFGSWRLFKEHCAWHEVMGNREESRGTKNFPRTETARYVTLHGVCGINGSEQDSHREICLRFLDTNRCATRSRFSRAAPKSFRWLSRYDSDWFNHYVPSICRSRKQNELF
ncbi:TniQ family protein [Collimonas humicola]|uniref:TniQ family protein n=1 Tax=Collimonas humicola TaxID=2825886 RepID=UPI001B8AEB35|nr:TniQ family protein [Collimonas humicola]